MKKYISLSLVICIMLTSMFALSSCFLHKCNFPEEWCRDDTRHWKECTSKYCEKISDEGEHNYGVGVITVKATQEADGISIRTCTACNNEMEQTIIFTGLSWIEWEEIFLDENFKNFTYVERAIVSYSGIQATSVTVYNITETEIKASITIGDTTSSETARGPQAETVKNNLISELKKMLKYENFTYDRDQKAYNLTGTMMIPNIGNAKTATLKFENGKPKELIYTCVVYSNGIPMDCKSTITFRDFGTTEI